MTIYEYAKLGTEQKKAVLKNDGLFLEHYIDNDRIVYIYFLNNFFIEVTTKQGKVIDNIPFIRGYKIDKRNLHMIEKRNAVFKIAA